MKTVLYIYDPAWRLWSRRAAGMMRAARRLGWNIEPVIGDLQAMKTLGPFFHPVGLIYETGQRRLIGRLPGLRGIPSVSCDEPGLKSVASVDSDPLAPAREAAVQLARLDLPHYACAGLPLAMARGWSDRRVEIFRREMELRGHPVDRCFGCVGENARSYVDLFDGICAWLKALPKPCGIFAVSDFIGVTLIEACSETGVRVPADVAILSVDDDDLFCENCVPTLSSVSLDFERSGELAVELLEERMQHPDRPPRKVVFGVRGTTHRQSTTVLRRPDSRVAETLEWIRFHAAEPGFSADVVAKHLGCTRRNVDLLFSRSLGRTVNRVIEDARLSRARELLAQPDSRVNLVASACGFANDTTFRRLFKRRFGCSPTGG